jgi:hypothetical protein
MTTPEKINDLLVWYDVGDVIDRHSFAPELEDTFQLAYVHGFIESVAVDKFRVVRKPTTCNC